MTNAADWWHSCRLALNGLLSIPHHHRQIAQTLLPQSTADRINGRDATRLFSLFTRDESSAASFQLQAEIGPSSELTVPAVVFKDLCTWTSLYHCLVVHYLNNGQAFRDYKAGQQHAVPFGQRIFRVGRCDPNNTTLDMPDYPLLEPNMVEYDDPRPVIAEPDDQDEACKLLVLKRIDRRIIEGRVAFYDLDPHVSDVQVMESALYALSGEIRESVVKWFKGGRFRLRDKSPVEQLLRKKEIARQRIFGVTGL